MEVLKPGVNWEDMHLLAERVIIEHLLAIGIINKAPMEELVEKRVGAVFFPHGLGHFLGLRVHDIGGYTKGDKQVRSTKAGLKSLRTRRDMEEGMIITVEPGCYFIDFIIEEALKDDRAPYLNKAKIDEYRSVGGVRLEDDVLITKDGVECLSNLPRKWEDVEKIL
jgi:Xaa-Pro dipeptidase